MLVQTLWPTFSWTMKWRLVVKSKGRLETLTLADVRDAMACSRDASAMARTVVAEMRRRSDNASAQ